MKKIILNRSQLSHVNESTTTLQFATNNNDISNSLSKGNTQTQIQNAKSKFGGNITAQFTPSDGPGDSTITIPNANGGTNGASEAIRDNSSEIQKALSNGMNVGIDVSESSKVYTKKDIQEARLKNMKENGKVYTKKELFESFVRENNEKKKIINTLYKVITPYTSHKYQDGAWENVGHLFKAIKSLPFVSDMYAGAPNGGYGQSTDGLAKYKEYDVTIETTYGININGKLTCHAAGTVEDPWSSYDITFNLW